MRQFFNDNGIIYQHTCTSTPQQNGVAKRNHHHILNVAWALLFQAHLPLTFWGESTLTATHIINHLPSPILSKNSPYEILYKRAPTYDHLRVFGCLCYVTNVTPHKFVQRARKCLFVGYPIGQKAYRLYDLSTKQFFSSRSVVFHENTFPFCNMPQESQPDSPVLPLPISEMYQIPYLKEPVLLPL